MLKIACCFGLDFRNCLYLIHFNDIWLQTDYKILQLHTINVARIVFIEILGPNSQTFWQCCRLRLNFYSVFSWIQYYKLFKVILDPWFLDLKRVIFLSLISRSELYFLSWITSVVWTGLFAKRTKNLPWSATITITAGLKFRSQTAKPQTPTTHYKTYIHYAHWI